MDTVITDMTGDYLWLLAIVLAGFSGVACGYAIINVFAIIVDLFKHQG